MKLDVLRRAFARLHDAALRHSASLKAEWVEAREMEKRDRLVMEACRTVLADLDGTETGGP